MTTIDREAVTFFTDYINIVAGWLHTNRNRRMPNRHATVMVEQIAR